MVVLPFATFSKAYSLLCQQKICLAQNFKNFGSLKQAFDRIPMIQFVSKIAIRIMIEGILNIYLIFQSL